MSDRGTPTDRQEPAPAAGKPGAVRPADAKDRITVAGVLSWVLLVLNVPAMLLLWPMLAFFNGFLKHAAAEMEWELSTAAVNMLAIEPMWVGVIAAAMAAGLVAIQLAVKNKWVSTVANFVVAVIFGIFLAIWSSVIISEMSRMAEVVRAQQ